MALAGQRIKRYTFSNNSEGGLMGKSELRIFLCYASQDKPFVQALYDMLSRAGFKPWLDEKDLLPGQDWQLEIRKSVRNSHVAIVCLSQNCVNKRGFVQKEIRYALDTADELPEGKIFIIPLKIEDCDVPERLRHLQWLNYNETGSEDKLLATLQKALSTNAQLHNVDYNRTVEEHPQEYGYVCKVLGTQDQNVDFYKRIGILDGHLATFGYEGTFHHPGCAQPVYKNVFFFSKTIPTYVFSSAAEQAGCNIVEIDEYLDQKMVEILKLEM